MVTVNNAETAYPVDVYLWFRIGIRQFVTQLVLEARTYHCLRPYR